MQVEPGFPQATLQKLTAMGHKIKEYPPWGSAQSIIRLGDHWEGASDPRQRDGLAEGYLKLRRALTPRRVRPSLLRTAEIGDIAVFDFGERHDGEHIDRAELLVDDCAIAEFRADAQIGFDERRQRRDTLARIDGATFENRPSARRGPMRRNLPLVLGGGLMMQKAQRQSERQWI